MKLSGFQAGHIKRLEWGIQFCQQDLDNLKPGAQLDLKTDLLDFISNSPLKLSLPSPEELKTNDIRTIQEGLSRQLKQLASQEPHDPQFVRSDQFNARVSVLGADAGLSFIHVVDMGNKLPELATKAFFDCLVWSGISRQQLRVCPVCRHIFLSKRKPRPDVHLHCSIRCSRLAATHRFREKQKDRLKHNERERSRRRYVEKQQRKYPGKKVRIGRSARKARKI